MSFEPRFIHLTDSPASRRFAVLHTPNGQASPHTLVVHASAFAEEMNKARRMVALQARALAAQGHMVLVPDLLGCGDSPGDFADASWEQWVQDIVDAAAWLSREHARRWPTASRPHAVLWGLRAGALLASAAAQRRPERTDLILWQPATQGKLVLQQFLRLLSAGEVTSGKSKGTLAAARAALAAGQQQEVAGYLLAPALVDGLEAARLAPAGPAGALHVIEVSPRPESSTSPAVQQALAPWKQAGWHTTCTVVAGPSFWQTTEIEDVPALLPATTSAFRRLLDGEAATQGAFGV